MYEKFFGLKQEPFSIAPDPHYLFMSERHREALAHLLYGTGGGGGFVLLTGEIGAGKTTVCRCFLEQIPKRCNVAYIFNPKLTVTELLKSVCDEFHIPYAAAQVGDSHSLTIKDYLDPLNNFLLKTHAVGLNNILIIDEAQHLSAEVLEQLRLLTNLETRERKLLQIILIGQPELRDMLARPELEQLAQRVIAQFHLGALTEVETSRYIRHRLSVAGLTNERPFDGKARKRVYELSGGVPRRINLLCDRALLGAYAAGKTAVDVAVVNKAAQEVFATSGRFKTAASHARGPWWHQRMALWAIAFGAVVLVVTVGVVVWGVRGGWRSSVPTQMALPAAGVAHNANALAPVVAASSASAVGVSTANSQAPVASLTTPAVDVEALARLKFLIREEDIALRELATLWSVTLDPVARGTCPGLALQQLQCFKATTTLAFIRQMARPGVITLHDDKGKPVYALLTGLGDSNISVTIGGVVRTMSLASLAQLWQGEFLTLWRAPERYRGPVSLGQSGPVVLALAEQLARVRSEPPPTAAEPFVFDAALKAKVVAFQVAQGLQSDGVAGATTFMQLNRVLQASEPRLQAL
jgi:general secretion pathway protein A